MLSERGSPVALDDVCFLLVSIPFKRDMLSEQKKQLEAAREERRVRFNSLQAGYAF